MSIQQTINNSYKYNVKAASTENIPLDTVLPVVDGYQTVDGDRVLLKDQNNPLANGIYKVLAGLLYLDNDNDGDTAFVNGATVRVVGGDTNTNKEYYIEPIDPLDYATAAKNWVISPFVGTGTGGSVPSTEQVTANATGVDNYIATSTSGIDDYDTTVIYRVDFDETNTGTSVINIDGKGDVPLKTYDESGLEVDLIGGFITPGFVYYLAFDGSAMQIFDTNPRSSDPLVFVNPAPIPAAVGQLAVGSTFPAPGVNLLTLINDMLYPQPTFTSFYISTVAGGTTFSTGGTITLEVGRILPLGAMSFKWAISGISGLQNNKTTIYDGSTPIAPNIATAAGINTYNGYTLPSNIVYNTTAQRNWVLKALRTNGNAISRTFSVVWRHRAFYGVSALAMLAEPQIEALTNLYPVTVTAATLQFTGAGYKYYAVPTNFAHPTLFKDFNTNLAVAMADTAEGFTDSTAGQPYKYKLVTVNNGYINITYRLYRTRNYLNGNIKISIT